jgi:hypothetical protein
MSYNQMTEDDYTILNITDYDYYHNGINIREDEIMVGSEMLTWYKSWPKKLAVADLTYLYDGVTALPECFSGVYCSVAIYKKVQ